MYEDVLLRQTHERLCDVWKECKHNPIDPEQYSCIGLPCKALLVFAGLHFSWLHREKSTKELWVAFYSASLKWNSRDLVEPCRFLDQTVATNIYLVFAYWTRLLLLIYVWYLGLDCWYTDNEVWNHLKQLLLNRCTNGLERRLKHLRMLTKVSCKKSKPTKGNTFF